MYQNRQMPFTEKQMQQVFATNLIDFAVQNGFQVEKGDRYAVHVKNSGGLYLFKNGKGFHCFSTDKKGNIIDFVKEYFGLGFIAAVEMILNCKAYEQTTHFIQPAEKEAIRELILLPEDQNCSRAMAYLVKTRKLDWEIVHEMVKQKKIYQTLTVREGKEYRNCAFVGYDEDGKARYCALRGLSGKSSFRQDVPGSDKTYGFTMEGTSTRIYVFEAPIDAMSHATLCKWRGGDWRADHRVSEGCLSDRALNRYLETHAHLREIVFCYDNDIDGRLPDGTPHNHGQEKAREAAAKYAGLGYDTFIQTPRDKDFNASLKTVYEWAAKIKQESASEDEEELECGYG